MATPTRCRTSLALLVFVWALPSGAARLEAQQLRAPWAASVSGGLAITVPNTMGGSAAATLRYRGTVLQVRAAASQFLSHSSDSDIGVLVGVSAPLSPP